MKLAPGRHAGLDSKVSVRRTLPVLFVDEMSLNLIAPPSSRRFSTTTKLEAGTFKVQSRYRAWVYETAFLVVRDQSSRSYQADLTSLDV